MSLQDFGTILRDQDIVFKAHPDALFRDIYTWLASQHHPFSQRFVIVTDVVNIQAKKM